MLPLLESAPMWAGASGFSGSSLPNISGGDAAPSRADSGNVSTWWGSPFTVGGAAATATQTVAPWLVLLVVAWIAFRKR